MNTINTINDFKRILVIAKQMDQGNRIFRYLDKPNFLKNIESYLNYATQKRFNYFTILEIQKNVKKSKKNIPNKKNIFFLSNVYDIYYVFKENPLLQDFKTKYDLLIKYLSSQGFKKSTIHTYNWQCKNIIRFLTMIDGSQYDEIAKDRVIELLSFAKSNKFISKDFYNRMKRLSINVLDYSISKTITIKFKQIKELAIIESLQLEINNYISYELYENHLKRNTVLWKKITIENFAEHLTRKNIINWYQLTDKDIIDYSNSLTDYTINKLRNTFCNLRNFLRYLYKKHITINNFSYTVPKCNYHKNAHLPSMYTEKEIASLLNHIDRSSEKGKRDYVMILLAASLGLRTADICNLKFSELNWKQDKIIIHQQKTKQLLILPLFAEVGNALIDYIEARVKVKSQYVFISLKAPFVKLESGAFHNIITKRMREAHIKIGDRKHGGHSLRHSMCGHLMNEGIPINVISDIVGHFNKITTAQYYIRSDLKQLKSCALEVNFTMEEKEL